MMIAEIFKYKAISGRNSLIQTLKRKQAAKIIFFLLGLAFMFFIYSMSVRFLGYMRGVSLLGPVLVAKFYEMLFLLFFSMLTFSSLIAGFNLLLSSRDMPFLASLPLTQKEIYLIKYFETAVHSSWMVLLIFCPIFLATGKVYNAGILFYLFAFLSFVFLAVAASSIGFFLSCALLKIFPTRKVRDIFLILGVLGGAAIYVFFRLLSPERLVNPAEIMGIFEYLTSLSNPADRFLPGYWMTKAVLLFAVESYSGGFFWLGVLFVLAAGFFSLSYFVFSGSMLRITQAIQGAGGKTGTGKNISESPFRAFIRKDFRLFIRDTAQWSQFFLLAALIVVYVFNIYKLPLDSAYLKSLVGFLNVSMAGFVVSSVCLRFVFTAVSLEGRSFWIIKSSPAGYRDYVLAKIVLNGIPVIFVALPIVLVSNIVLKISGVIFYTSVITIVLMTFVLLLMGIGFGMMYPKFDHENPVQIESSFGGFLYMTYSFFLIAFTVAVQAMPVRMHFLSRFGRPGESGNLPVIIFSGIVLLAVYFIAAYFPLKKGLAQLEKHNV